MAEEKKDSEYVRVHVQFLQQLVDYLVTKPYAEVSQFVEELTKPLGNDTGGPNEENN